MMNNAENMKGFRTELKYLCPIEYFKMMQYRLSANMMPDKHVGEDGYYLIRSLYFDSYNNKAYYDVSVGVDNRSKWRIRSYNYDSHYLNLEKKIKRNGFTKKITQRISAKDYTDILSGRSKNILKTKSLAAEFITEQRITGLRPVVIVEYQRVPFVLKENNVRITLDYNISACPADDVIYEKSKRKRLIMSRDKFLLEVKTDDRVPDYLIHSIHLKNIKETTFSKYFLCRHYSVMGGYL